MSRNYDSGFEGELLKLNNVTKDYQPRYFVIDLSTSTLHYYLSINLSTQTPKGSFKLADSVIIADEYCPVSFAIHTFKNDNQKIFHLKAGSEHERTAWLNSLELEKKRSEIKDR